MWYDLTDKKTQATEGFKVMEKRLQEVKKKHEAEGQQGKEEPAKTSPLKKTKRLAKDRNQIRFL